MAIPACRASRRCVTALCIAMALLIFPAPGDASGPIYRAVDENKNPIFTDMPLYPDRYRYIPVDNGYDSPATAGEMPKDTRPRTIPVKALVNKTASLILYVDTGATDIFLPKRVAERFRLGKLEGAREVSVMIADGRVVKARQIVLNSVKVGDAEAENVSAMIAVDDSADALPGDGLLGMSFLNRFNFKIDNKKKTITFEKD